MRVEGLALGLWVMVVAGGPAGGVVVEGTGVDVRQASSGPDEASLNKLAVGTGRGHRQALGQASAINKYVCGD